MVSRSYASTDEAFSKPGAMDPAVRAYNKALCDLTHQVGKLSRQIDEPPLKAMLMKPADRAPIYDQEEVLASEMIAKCEAALAEIKTHYRAALRKTRCRDAAMPRTGAQ